MKYQSRTNWQPSLNGPYEYWVYNNTYNITAPHMVIKIRRVYKETSLNKI